MCVYVRGEGGMEEKCKYLVASSSANLFFSSFFVSDSFFICCFTSSSSVLEIVKVNFHKS